MTLKSQLEQDFLTAYKAHEEVKVSVLRMLKSAIKNAEINAKGELSDEEVIKILRKEIKQRDEAIENYKKGNRDDLVAKDQAEIDLINPYLPAQMSEDEIEKIAVATITEMSAGLADMGKVIGAVMQKTGGNADGALVAQLVRKNLK